MSDLRIGGLSPQSYTPLGRPVTPQTGAGGFQETLKAALQDVNQTQLNSGDLVQRMVSGEEVDLHDVMMSAEEASVAFEMLMEIRNKLLEAYQEIQRMQV
jgi:flagellar hook-basal body complex protein FliE